MGYRSVCPIKEVYEDPSDFNYLTSYTYDVFGNLRTVSQGTQTRTFNYDSLSRLRSAINPESGTITYTYDDNGNLTQKTDARGVSSTHAYDALNRPTTRTYSDGTPGVTYAYDTAGVANSKGKLTSVSSSVSTYSYSGYDGMGRVSGGSQAIGSQTYTLSYGYDLAGHIKTITYPSGRTVNYAYDNADRASSVTGNLGDGTQRSYSTGITYDAGSRMTQEQFGTNTPIYNKLFYTSRGQLAEIREGLTPNNTTWERGAIINFYSTCWGMCAGQSMPSNNGNLLRQEHWIQNESGQVIGIPTQEFGYDSLNRLQWVKEGRQLLVTATAPVGTGTGLQAQYYDNMNFTNLKVTRTDATIDFDWGGGAPDGSLGVDTFTTRWTGKVEPQYSETYTFYTQTDDGVRLWVNGQLVIDKWIDQAPTEWSGQITLTAGQRYDIRMDFFENGGGAMARLSWSSPSQPKQIMASPKLIWRRSDRL
jgi:YD repeat-containing protein